jgi:hypothetical protein
MSRFTVIREMDNVTLSPTTQSKSFSSSTKTARTVSSRGTGPAWMVIPARALKRGDVTVDKTMLKEWRDYVVSVESNREKGSVTVTWMTPQLTTWRGHYGADDKMEIWRVK